jgi:transcriptional regulator with XRE-family HTH domain
VHISLDVLNQYVHFVVMSADYEQISRELFRALRGRRSQARLSQRLGYRSNVLYTWEAGTAFPSAARLFALAARAGVDVPAGLARFYREVPEPLQGVALAEPEGVRRLLVELRGRARLVDLAERTGFSRFTLSRWLSGRTQPSVPELLCLVDHASLRLLDFLSILIDPGRLDSVAEAWRRLQRARAMGYEEPLTQAVLRALETERYRRSPSVATLARLTGLTPRQVEAYLALLTDSGQVTVRGARHVASEVQVVDFRRDTAAAQRLKAFWAQLAADRVRDGAPGLSAYNVFAVSRADLAALERLQRAYLAEMRSLIARSEPSEVVALASFQLVTLGA